MNTILLRIKPLAAIFAAGAALFAAGCGSDNKADLVNGKTLFVQQCGSCHTLARAGTKGTIGPDLDAAFRQARIDGMNDYTIEGVVHGQIKFPGPKGRSVPVELYMPADIVTGTDARDVAAYVAAVAAKTGKDTGKLATAGGGGDGKSIFTNNCGSCHTLAAAGTSGTSGPNLDGIGKLGAAGIKQAIVDPNADIAAGFSAGVMPDNFGESLTPEDLKKLVAYLTRQK